MSTPSIYGGARDWITAKSAPARLSRPKATVYRWIEDGKIRTMRPLHETWCYLPDLLRVDSETPRRKRTAKSATPRLDR